MNNLSVENIIARSHDGICVVNLHDAIVLYREETRGLISVYRPIHQEYQARDGQWFELNSHWQYSFNNASVIENQISEAYYDLVRFGEEIVLYTSGLPVDVKYPNSVEFQRGLEVYVTDLFYENGELFVRGDVIMQTEDGLKSTDWTFNLTGLSLTA